MGQKADRVRTVRLGYVTVLNDVKNEKSWRIAGAFLFGLIDCDDY